MLGCRSSPKIAIFKLLHFLTFQHITTLTSKTDMLSCRLSTTKRSIARARHTMLRFDPHSSVGNICVKGPGQRRRTATKGQRRRRRCFFPNRLPSLYPTYIPNRKAAPFRYSDNTFPYARLTRWHAWHRKFTTPRCGVAISMKVMSEPKLKGEPWSDWQPRSPVTAASAAAAGFTPALGMIAQMKGVGIDARENYGGVPTVCLTRGCSLSLMERFN